MAGDEFVLRVRGAEEIRYFRFEGAEAQELHALLRQGQLDRPAGARFLSELIAGREPVRTEPRSSTADAEVDWDMVAPDELRGYLSQRLLERKGGREIDTSIRGEADPPPGAGTTL
ncbi:MAG TPA: hypothetical protein VG370_31685 [Chloroflexota bacterium]|jgi:hypothetical protein|nr:hypothetical protein [Chloroflexota bacterium]